MQAREAAGFPADAYTASATVTAAGRAQNKELIHAVMEEAWSAGFVSKVVCSAAIQAYARCGDVQVKSRRYFALALLIAQFFPWAL